MSQSITASPPMHDIPLSGAEERGDSAGEVHKTNNSKANSLKRFFKLSNKRHNGAEELPTSSSDIMPEDGGEPKNDLAGENSVCAADRDSELDKPKKEHTRRFNLRLGGITRIVDHSDTADFMPSAPSRQSLKNSISSYWHTVFRRASKRVGQKKSEQANDEEVDEREVEANETELEEEVQTLSISEDTIEQVTELRE
ncbi:unnamed protein product [Ceratitis capitata]|uniref:(Mediterranean fruit fly) hypothetical protein n=1 Tax=Ceratitis capitata TaxID=7213 RepID=A0A811UF09_CERCA|nr:unnamed protein product [Ceratitis capitata]